MPNGDNKNWNRLCAALDGFRSIYGYWPVRVRIQEGSLDDLASLFTASDITKIRAKVDLVSDVSATFIAEDDLGNSYSYGENVPPKLVTRMPRAAEWLRVKPLHED